MKVLDYEQVHKFESETENAHWSGWDLILFTPMKSAEAKPYGVFHNGKWGRQVTVSPDSKGNWSFR